MRYSLYLHKKGSQHFLQTASEIENLQRDKATISRWMFQMGVTAGDAARAVLVIHDKEVPLLSLSYALNKRAWKVISVKDVDLYRILDVDFNSET